MKRVGLTQRVDNHKSRDERRDSLDQNWTDFVMQLGAHPHPIPNKLCNFDNYFENLELDAVIFTGGNDIVMYAEDIDEVAPERDRLENELFSFCRTRSIPILGACRGMQFINLQMGGRIQPADNHISNYHLIYPQSSTYLLPSPRVVNSYHRFVIEASNLGEELIILATSDDGLVECFSHKIEPIYAIMWHPEREKPFNQTDIMAISRALRI